MLEYYDIIQETHKEWEDKFGDFIEGLRSRGVCVILFGSKALQRDNLLSDFDIAIITKDSKFKLDLEVDFPAEVFVYTAEECLKEIKSKNTILLDAFTLGKLLFDNIGVYNDLKNEVEEIAMGLVRTSDGWIAKEIAEKT
ncbi:MAG: nucleotidyltransferase domain-containing protein [Archaeoglobaceae archaeon]